MTDTEAAAQTVREALGELTTYGDHASQHPLDLPAVTALDILVTELREAEEQNERLTAKLAGYDAAMRKLNAPLHR